jgi:hypothetical protein
MRYHSPDVTVGLSPWMRYPLLYAAILAVTPSPVAVPI